MGQICAWIFAILSVISKYTQLCQYSLDTHLTDEDIKNGYGVHVWDLHLDKITPFKKVCQSLTL